MREGSQMMLYPDERGKGEESQNRANVDSMR